jgi:hypothetical protein
MKAASRLCIAGAFAITLLGQTPPRDVDGWGKIKWGMTSAEASQAYVIDRHEDNESWAQLIAARHGSDQISRVRLWMNSASTRDFDMLKAHLIQKYGPPVDGETRTEGNDGIRTFLWTFPSTWIRLTLAQDQKNQNRIDLEYMATDQKALDAL